jgi:hypothetical protein
MRSYISFILVSRDSPLLLYIINYGVIEKSHLFNLYAGVIRSTEAEHLFTCVLQIMYRNIIRDVASSQMSDVSWHYDTRVNHLI